MATNASTAATLTCLMCLVESPQVTSATEPSVVAEDSVIESGDPGIRLFVRNKHPAGMTRFRAEKTVLYVHGATQAASCTFDLKISNESWMDYIAARGYDVYLVDLRGYGRSTRPPEFTKPPEENPPVVRTDVAVRDVAAAVDSILQRRRTCSRPGPRLRWRPILTVASRVRRSSIHPMGTTLMIGIIGRLVRQFGNRRKLPPLHWSSSETGTA